MCQGCEASLYLKASENGRLLEVTNINENHSHRHEILRTLYSSHLLNKRKLKPETKAIVLELLDLKAKKKNDTEQNNERKWYKVLTLKNLSNINYIILLCDYRYLYS